MYRVEDLFNDHREVLSLTLISGQEHFSKRIPRPEVHRPGLALSGFLKKFVASRLLIFGQSELLYLKELQDPRSRLDPILSAATPAVIVAAGFRIPRALRGACQEKGIALFSSEMATIDLLSSMTTLLSDAFAPRVSRHGTFIEVYGVGVLIQGPSSIGKSEAALALIERGHRLISDDVVQLRLRNNSTIEGTGPELNRHMMEIRGIGIINVAHLYGAVCVRSDKTLDLVIELQEWDDGAFYDRVGLDETCIDLLGVPLPFHILPVKPGRDVALLIETLVLNYRLKRMGYHSAREFNVKLLDAIAKKTKVSKGSSR